MRGILCCPEVKFLFPGLPQPRDEGRHDLLVRRCKRGGFGRLRHTGLFLSVLQRVDQHLGRAQIGTGRFVDQLLGDRLALGDLPPLAVDGHGHLFVERLDQQCRQVLRARSARVTGLAFLESGMHRRLAAADLVIALALGNLGLRHGEFPPCINGDPLHVSELCLIIN